MVKLQRKQIRVSDMSWCHLVGSRFNFICFDQWFSLIELSADGKAWRLESGTSHLSKFVTDYNELKGVAKEFNKFIKEYINGTHAY